MSDERKMLHPCPHLGCKAVFTRPYRLSAHILTHQNRKAFKCMHENCGREYTSNSHLIRHYKAVHSDNSILAEPHNCPQCWKAYRNKQNLQRHMKLNHSPQSKKFTCSCCQMQFLKEHMLITHMYQHTGIKGFYCELCSQSFVTLREKTRHFRYHKSYTCEQCEQVFPHWTTYQEHRKTVHVGEEYICEHCARTFKMRNHILRHLKLHDIEKRVVFTCPVNGCPKFYTTKYNVKQHIESAHLYKTFDCSICEAKLSTKDKLNKHMKVHDPNIPIKQVRRKPKPRKDKGVPRSSLAVKLANLDMQTIACSLTVDGNDFSAEVNCRTDDIDYSIPLGDNDNAINENAEDFYNNGGDLNNYLNSVADIENICNAGVLCPDDGNIAGAVQL